MTPRQPSHPNTGLERHVVSHELSSISGEHAVDGISIFVKVSNRPPLSDDMIELGEAPGCGWELDEDFIYAHGVGR